MSLIEEISSICGLPFNEVIKETNIHVFSNKCVSITNFKTILSYSEDKIIIKVKDNVISILGDNLIIKDIDTNSIVIYGKINSFEYSR
ncbi:MAG: YabP/YqfC family sporulation protein [Clostridia bacterium]|nr:YabP/YqfC family sporulation protein [Clostridia bacterium]